MSDRNDIIAKVNALLKKAESTEFPKERDAFMDGAFVLMAKYQIDHALLVASRNDAGDVEQIIEKAIPVSSGPYVNPLRILASGIAKACGVKYLQDSGSIYLIGYESDVETTEFIWTSVQNQMLNEIKDVKPGEDDVQWKNGRRTKVSTVTYRRNFCSGYVRSVVWRFTEMMKETTDEAVATSQDPGSTALVLVDRKKAVDNDVKRRYPKTGKARRSRYGYAGSDAGSSAGNRANLGRGLSGQRALHG
jgi:hypothetical protein